MRVLGISPLDKDSTVSFMEDGRVLFACSEERLSRVKLQDGFPHRALELGLKRLGWNAVSIDQVAYAFFDGETESRLMQDAVTEDARTHRADCTATCLNNLRAVNSKPYRVDRTRKIPGLVSEQDEFLKAKAWYKRIVFQAMAVSPQLDWRSHRRILHRWQREAAAEHRHWTEELQRGLSRYGLDHKLKRFHHHDTHAANAFYSSGYKEALIVTLDGYGSGCAGGIYTGNAQGFQVLQRFQFPNSLGHFYEHVTSGLGFKPNRHEGKIVGLAAYGDPTILAPVLLERFNTNSGDLRMRAALNHFFTRALTARYAKRDVAAAYQYVLEEVTRRVVGYWVQKTGIIRIAMSGGVHANVKLNQRIREIPGVESIFVYPNMGDGGCATGAAMLAFDRQVFRDNAIDTVYYGPDFSEEEIQTALKRENLSFERIEEIEERIAQLLTEDRIIGRFQGNMEYGPRALGNRSILYPARDPEVNQWLNKQLGRTEFMPFAPAALASEAHCLFKNLAGCEKTAEFMTVTFDCTEEMISKCPAAVHIDGTARPQLVSERTNPSFHRILQSYFALTGIPAIINTSFNMHEEPIVCTPEDAVRAFLLGNIDYLAIGKFLVPHPKLQEILKDRRQMDRKKPIATNRGY